MRSRWSLRPLFAFAFAILSAGVQQTSAQDLALAKPRFIATWVAAGEANDASGVAVLQRRVSLDLTDVPVAAALRMVVSQARLDLSYDKSILPTGRRVSLHAQELTVVAALTETLLQSGLDVVVGRGGQLGLVRKQGAAVADTGSIAGQVTDRGGRGPLAGATVTVEGTRHATTTGEDGRYRIADVAPGTYTVRVRYIGYSPGSAGVTVSADQETTANFALEKSAQRLDEVVTTGTIVPTEIKAVPTPISVIDATDIAQQRPPALADVIRQAIPTAVAFHTPDGGLVQSLFSVRGASSLSGGSPMKIFVDGVEAASYTITAIDPNSIERIEAVRGPEAATIYGADAAGGVVQIFTKRGDSTLTRPHVDAQTALGVAQTPYAGFGGVIRQQYSGSLRGGAQGLSYNFGAGYTRLADYLPDGEISRQTSPSIYGGMRFDRGIIAADLSARYYHNNLPSVFNPLFATTGLSFFVRPQFQPQDFVSQMYGSRITVSPTGWWRNQLTMGADRSSQDAVQTQRRLTSPDDTLYALYVTASQKFSIGYNTSLSARMSRDLAGSLTVGLDHYEQNASTFSTSSAISTEGTIATSPSGDFSQSRSSVTNTGYFAQAQVSLRDAIFLTGGLRAEKNSTFGPDLGTPVLPRVGLSVVRQVGQSTVKVRGAYGRAIRAPSPGLAFGSVTATQVTLANPLLAPEQQQGWDAGVDVVFGERGSLGVTAYAQTAKDLIVYVQLASTPPATAQFQNIGRVTNRGVEIEGTLNLRPLQLRAQYGYVRSRIEDLGPGVSPGAELQVGDEPIRTPKHTAGAAVTVTPVLGTTFTAGLSYVGSFRGQDFLALFSCFGGTGPCQATSRDYVVRYPGFAKLNAAFTQRIHQNLEGFVSVDNLTNNEAYEGGNQLPVQGRITMFGLHVDY